MLKGFKNFLMQGELIVIAVGLVVALAFSTLIKAFTDNIITPLVNSAGGKNFERARLDHQRAKDQRGCVRLRDRLFHHIHGRDLLRSGRSLPGIHEEARYDSVR